ncbi:hypothetical protein LG329_13770 [Virgibacillus necropolis]|uniref:hypothetical protein n=1 Tax=Virgibacillus necropolis TaxID=163877 RepID=UPI003850E540
MGSYYKRQNAGANMRNLEVQLEDILAQLQKQRQKQKQYQDQDQNQAQVDTDTSNFENIGNPVVHVHNDITIVVVIAFIFLQFQDDAGGNPPPLDLEALREMMNELNR